MHLDSSTNNSDPIVICMSMLTKQKFQESVLTHSSSFRCIGTNVNLTVSTGLKLQMVKIVVRLPHGPLIFNHLGYDDKSIMHYGGSREACMENPPEPYMTLKSSGREIPVNKELSVLDIQALKQIYQPPCK